MTEMELYQICLENGLTKRQSVYDTDHYFYCMNAGNPVWDYANHEDPDAVITINIYDDNIEISLYSTVTESIYDKSKLVLVLTKCQSINFINKEEIIDSIKKAKINFKNFLISKKSQNIEQDF